MNTILIVDDNEINMDICVQNLSPPIGVYNVISAQNGLEGFNLAKQYCPDLIILDIMMPVMDGYETIKALKNDNCTKDIPILMLTAKNMSEDVVLALKLGANDYLVKPYNLMELSARVDVLISLRNAQIKTKQYIELLESKAEMLLSLCEGAHDLNGMLSSMGVIELLREEISDIKNILPEDILAKLEKKFELINKLADNTQNMIEIGKSIVSSSMSMSEIVTIFKDEYSLLELINTSVGFLTNKIISNKINLEIFISDDHKVFVQKDEWQRMFMNIIKNAIEAMCFSKERNLRIQTSITENIFIIKFIDTGEGISEENIEKIFSGPFSSRKNGHGLGLSFVKKTVCKYNGFLNIKSKIDNGTIFELVFPKHNIIKEA